MSVFIAAQFNSREIRAVQMSVNRTMEDENVPHILKAFRTICVFVMRPGCVYFFPWVACLG